MTSSLVLIYFAFSGCHPMDCDSMNVCGTWEPYEKILIPFTGSPRSLLLLTKILPRRNKIYLLYIVNLNTWNGEKQLHSVQNLIACFADYWMNNLKSQLFICTLNDAETEDIYAHTLDASQAALIRHVLLLNKCHEIAKYHQLNKVILSTKFQNIIPSNSNVFPTEYVTVPNSLIKCLEMVDEQMMLYPLIVREDSSVEDVWKWCCPCHNQYLRVSATDASLQHVECCVEDEIFDFLGCCDNIYCDVCAMYKRVIFNIGIFEEEVDYNMSIFINKVVEISSLKRNRKSSKICVSSESELQLCQSPAKKKRIFTNK